MGPAGAGPDAKGVAGYYGIDAPNDVLGGLDPPEETFDPEGMAVLGGVSCQMD